MKSGYNWLDRYQLIMQAVGWLSLGGAVIIAILALFNVPPRGGIIWILANVVFTPILLAISGVACLAFCDLIDLVMEMRNNLRRLIDDIDAARKRQADRLKSQK